MAEYLFTFDVIASDREGYYIDRWDRSNRYEAIGETKEAAWAALQPVLGEAPRGRFWKARQVGTALARSNTTDLSPRYERLRVAAQELVTRYEAAESADDYASEIEAIREVLNTP